MPFRATRPLLLLLLLLPLLCAFSLAVGQTVHPNVLDTRLVGLKCSVIVPVKGSHTGQIDQIDQINHLDPTLPYEMLSRICTVDPTQEPGSE